jgi:hypothetical protein
MFSPKKRASSIESMRQKITKSPHKQNSGDFRRGFPFRRQTMYNEKSQAPFLHKRGHASTARRSGFAHFSTVHV